MLLMNVKFVISIYTLSRLIFSTPVKSNRTFNARRKPMSEIKELISIAAATDPLTLAILFIGLIGLGLIWLASIAIASTKK